ncbi:Hypothetical protein BIBO1_2545 [Brucella inopinata BO1]|nr:Hypothetical protein BIBO1_2545 [Brucella inopinata BO1]
MNQNFVQKGILECRQALERIPKSVKRFSEKMRVKTKD